MKALLTAAQRAALLANGRRTAAGENIDPVPVVKLFTPDAGATWLLNGTPSAQGTKWPLKAAEATEACIRSGPLGSAKHLWTRAAAP